MKKKHSINNIIGKVLKIIVSVLALGYIVWKIRQEMGLIGAHLYPIGVEKLGLIIVALLLVIPNQGLEAWKWAYMTRKYYPEMTFRKALEGILAGNAAGIFTPNRLGEYAGRMFYLPHGKRTEALTLTLTDRLCQMLVTIWMGVIAGGYMIFFTKQIWLSAFPFKITYLYTFFSLLVAGCLIVNCIVIYPHTLLNLLAKKFSWRWIHSINHTFAQVSSKDLWTVYIVSIFRYLIFTFQYFLLLPVFGYKESFLLAIMLIWVIFLIKSIIPSISLAELGIRESVAITVMSAFGIGAITAVGSTFLLYIFNIALPAAIGVRYIQKVKI